MTSSILSSRFFFPLIQNIMKTIINAINIINKVINPEFDFNSTFAKHCVTPKFELLFSLSILLIKSPSFFSLL